MAARMGTDQRCTAHRQSDLADAWRMGVMPNVRSRILEARKKQPCLDLAGVRSLLMSFPIDQHASEGAGRELARPGASPHTVASYEAAMRYWRAWFAARYAHELSLPVEVPVVLQFIVDHSLREVAAPPHNADEQAATRQSSGEFQSEAREELATTLEIGLPPEIDAALVASGAKGKLGALSLSTLEHRVAVLSKAHQNLHLDNPCNREQVRELLKSVRRAYSARNVRPRKQEALTRDLLEQVVATCDDSPRGLRDHALLLFAFSSGGRRSSEVSKASMENLRKVHGGYVYSLTQAAANQHRSDDKPIAGLAAIALDAWLAVANIATGPIFRRVLTGGKVLEDGLVPAAVRKIVKERCRKAGLRGDFSAHSLRSGFATEAGRQKMSAVDAMKMAGHRAVETFMGYYRDGDPKDDKTIDLLGD